MFLHLHFPPYNLCHHRNQSSTLFQVFFESDEVHACIVTCGGLCPGLNTVIREIVCGLYHMYGVRTVVGIEVIIDALNFP